MIIPGQKTPELRIDTVSGESFDLNEQHTSLMTLVCFYRGAHCAICRRYLLELAKLAPNFAERDVKVIAVSMDTEQRARLMLETIGSNDLQVGYGLTAETAQNWHLYLSSHRGKTSVGLEESSVFTEPALFLIKPSRSTYFVSVQSMPFARPPLPEILQMVDFAKINSYDARGGYMPS
ncbi:MAG: AhpC/TSA family protein [Herminiimonas sp.]|nr:AhpC/TSA family protein [Herminiimonas sp.]